MGKQEALELYKKVYAREYKEKKIKEIDTSSISKRNYDELLISINQESVKASNELSLLGRPCIRCINGFMEKKKSIYGESTPQYIKVQCGNCKGMGYEIRTKEQILSLYEVI